MNNQNSKELGHRYIEVIWNQAELNRLDEFTAPDIVRHDPASGVQRGFAAYSAVVQALHTAFHPMHFVINWHVGEGAAAAHHWTVTGTHVGEFNGIAPTGKQFTLDGVSIYRFANGKLVEERTVGDALSLLKQLGVAI
ncbi:MAG: ester cyclase [Acidobacteria bacterium]|nr:ester cyclase [Acidobacteriota bacterium]MBI3424755.1 ester cyclase [Acidobacteriota bacterium]